MLIFLLVAIPIAYIKFYQAPTCFDGKQNQGEAGIDCGGSCTLLCLSQYVPLNVEWSRFYKVNEGIYNVLAYIENPNISAEANNLDYVFKLYDKEGVLLKERFGRTFSPASKILTVFEPDMRTGNLVPQRVEFAFTSPALWLKKESAETNISVTESTLTRLDSTPRLTTKLSNKTVNQIKNIEAVAILYNASGNTIAFSRTVIDALNDRESILVNFNWSKPFTETVAQTEIVLKVLK